MARGTKKKKQKKIWFACAIACTISVLLLVWWFGDFSGGKPIRLGVTFSKPYAEYLGNDWRANYKGLLEDLNIKHLRLVAYWDAIESVPGTYDFSDLDWQIAEAGKHNAQVILAMGRKVPRWPECSIPSYLLKEKEEVQNMALTKFIKAVVEHYRNENNITMWQVENEPFVKWFGNCPKIDSSFVKKEVELVRLLDTRPIVLTDSGELGSWYKEGSMGDYFGMTMYQVVWSKNWGYMHYYVFRPFVYRFKAFLTGIKTDRAFIAELQAESWFPDGDKNISLEEQKISMNAEQLRANVELARRTGFGTAYLWGSEYWYWLKNNGDNSLWNTVKELIQISK